MSHVHRNEGNMSAGRLRSERVADGVVAGYIRMLSTKPRVIADPEPPRARVRAAGDHAHSRAHGQRRRSGSFRGRPAPVQAGCAGADGRPGSAVGV